MRIGAALLALVALLSGSKAAAQGVQLTGTHVQYLAVGTDGTMICSAADCGASRSMQYREAPLDPPSCDLYAPGTPHETFTVEARAGGSPVRFTNSGASAIDAVATVEGPTIVGRTITWSGRASGSGVVLAVDQTFALEAEDRYARLSVTLTNQGASPLTEVHYLRNGDPDLGQCSIGSSFATNNDVRRQPPVDDAALATIRGGDGSAAGRRLVLGIGSHDPRARAHTGGFANTDASGEWSAPLDAGGASGDVAVDLVLREASLAPGASTTFEILYVWGPDEATVESRFDELGFPAAPCVGLAEAAACTTDLGTAGLCRAGRCCTGCWDGGRCRTGTSAASCGLAGAVCLDCADGDACTSDLCEAGACENPDAPAGTRCDDGLFCTAVDACDGRGACAGAGDACDDRQTCTVDTCDEDTDSCTNAGLADGTACAQFGASGECRASACCTGCFDGSVCRVGTAASACGAGGGACAVCTDADACTSDVCRAGACENPPAPAGTGCDDGEFCTASDRCDGSGGCVGSGARCDDAQSCTTDSCDEALDRCDYAVTSGCIIGGECVETGAQNPSYPCQVCDPVTDARDWSARVEGAMCGKTFCSVGRVLTRSCDAMGQCLLDPPVACPSGLCDAEGAMCGDGCTDETCREGEFCDPRTRLCQRERAAGSACGGAGECASGACVDGVCCESRCDGLCERCDLSGEAGRCAPVPVSRDPDDECELACDGMRDCQRAPDAGMPSRDAGVREDAAMAEDAAVSRPDAGGLIPGIDAGLDGGFSGGCGCRAAGGPSGPTGMAWLAGIFAWLCVAGRRRAG